MGVGQPHLQSFEDFKNWVVANNQSGHEVHAPGNTGWEYQVPFWTANAKKSARLFDEYTHFAKDVSAVDEATGLKIWHGYWCTGYPANGSYDTYIRDDIQGDTWKNPPEEIHASTIGVKFYCLGEEQPQTNTDSWTDPKLVVINMSLRIAKDGTLFCLPVRVATNIHFVGGHGGGTFSDATHHCYTSLYGWNSQKATNPWSHFSTYEPKKKKAVQQYHKTIFEKLLASLA